MSKQAQGVDLDDLITSEDAAEILHVNLRTLTRWRWQGLGPPYIRPGIKRGPVLYQRSVLSQYLAGRVVRPVGEEEAA